MCKSELHIWYFRAGSGYYVANHLLGRMINPTSRLRLWDPTGNHIVSSCVRGTQPGDVRASPVLSARDMNHHATEVLTLANDCMLVKAATASAVLPSWVTCPDTGWMPSDWLCESNDASLWPNSRPAVCKRGVWQMQAKLKDSTWAKNASQHVPKAWLKRYYWNAT